MRKLQFLRKKKETNVKNDPIISGVNTALISSMLPWNVTQLEFNNMSLSIFNTDSTFLLHHNLKLVSAIFLKFIIYLI